MEQRLRSRKILVTLFRPVFLIDSQSDFRQLFAKMFGVPFRNTLRQEDHQVKLAELGWTPEERLGASEFVCLDKL